MEILPCSAQAEVSEDGRPQWRIIEKDTTAMAPPQRGNVGGIQGSVLGQAGDVTQFDDFASR